jgi:hypothetical protein
VVVVISATLSGFYLTAMSVDRAVAVRFPMAAPSLCTTGKAKKVVLIGTVILTGANCNLIYTMQYVKDEKTGKNSSLIKGGLYYNMLNKEGIKSNAHFRCIR